MKAACVDRTQYKKKWAPDLLRLLASNLLFVQILITILPAAGPMKHGTFLTCHLSPKLKT